MADDLNPAAESSTGPPRAGEARSLLARRRRSASPVRSAHADRFRVVLAGLIGIAVGALAVAAAVLVSQANRTAGGGPGASAGVTVPWSTWRPSSTGNAGAAQIADYVAPFYRLSTTQQLTVITPINVTQLNATTGTFTGNGLTVALDLPSSSSGSSSGGTLRPLPGQTVAYDLCGQGGADCSLAGRPSTLRLLLLRREALELALYTFRYLPRAQNVVAVLPPGRSSARAHAKPVVVAVLFQRPELAPLLQAPITTTLQDLPPTVAQLPTWKRTPEAGLVDQVTSRNLFSERTETQQTGSSLLVLNPLPAQ
ncbi:MAG TPA: hypothetical protein VFN48_11150 [Solirubrobacteraceae bacterium]|nr:hypothetical protein [Solirubrobacteraceae bacterium]